MWVSKVSVRSQCDLEFPVLSVVELSVVHVPELQNPCAPESPILCLHNFTAVCVREVPTLYAHKETAMCVYKVTAVCARKNTAVCVSLSLQK